jgi:hypothetical protein
VFMEMAGFLGGVRRGGFTVDGDRVPQSDAAAAQHAWQMVACDYGLDCGPSFDPVLSPCIWDGLCGLASFEEASRKSLPSQTYDRAVELRARIIAALQRKDFASLGLGPVRDRPQGGKKAQSQPISSGNKQ